MNLDEAYKLYLLKKRDSLPTSSMDDEFIIFFGDSFTYGENEAVQDTFPVAYERCINRRGKTYKVLNLGVSSTAILDQAYFFERVMRESLSSLKIKAFVFLHTQNDRYIEHWGLHPYEVCSGYPYSGLRVLQHKLFLAYYLDYLAWPKSHFKNDKLFKEPVTEQCLQENFSNIDKIAATYNTPVHHLYLFDSIKSDISAVDLRRSGNEFFDSFKRDFPANYIYVNDAFNSVPDLNSLYSSDDYHFNPTANAMIGEYLCDKIEL